MSKNYFLFSFHFFVKPNKRELDFTKQPFYVVNTFEHVLKKYNYKDIWVILTNKNKKERVIGK